jgi:flagellar motor switch protein FliG
MALCLYILPENRRLGIIEAFSAKLQRDAVEGFASLDGTTPDRIDFELSSLKTQLVPSLLKSSVIRFAIAEDITQLMDEASPKTRASLQEALSLHKDLDDQINASLITFDDVLAVDDDTLGELLDEFSPEQTAILMSGVGQEHNRRIAKILPRKIAVSVESELSRISSRQSSLKRAQNQSLEYQSLLRERLKDLVAEGVIELDKGNSSKSKESDSSSDQEQELSPGSRESA